MNNKLIIAGVVFLVLAGGGVFFSSQQSKSAENAKMAQEEAAMVGKEGAVMEGNDEVMMKNDDSAMEKDDAMMQKSDDQYVEYSKTVLDNASSNRRVLFFYASWCPTCKSADADLKANTSKIPTDVAVIRVNYSDSETDQEEKDLAKKYGITYQHTYVQIDGQGKEIMKWNGGKTDELLTKIK